MRLKLLTVLLIWLPNISFGQTQLDLNEAAQHEYVKADKELNVIYNRILKENKADTIFVTNARNAQRIWIQFRDAEVRMKFPEREQGYYGSVHPMCWSIYLTQLTKDRIKTLRMWVNGVKEGDACAGSVKTK